MLWLWAEQGDAAQVDGRVKAVVQRFERRDIAVANAGVTVTGSDGLETFDLTQRRT